MERWLSRSIHIQMPTGVTIETSHVTDVHAKAQNGRVVRGSAMWRMCVNKSDWCVCVCVCVCV